MQPLSAGEEQYRMLVETMSDGLSVIDENGIVTYLNGRLCEIWGYSREERDQLVGRRCTDFVDEENRHVLEQQLTRRRAGDRESYELVWIRKNGEPVSTIVSPEPIFSPGGDYRGSFAIITDITERKRAEEMLRQREARFRELYDEAPIGYHEIDAEGRIINVNQTELNMLGYRLDEMVGRPVWDFIVESDSSRRAFAAKITGKEPVGGAFERTYRRKDGTNLPVTVEDRPSRDSEGRVVGIRSTIQDITERKRAEAALARRTAELARSNAELEQFAYVVSHDLREPLRMVTSYLQLLERRYKGQLDDEADEFIFFAVDGAQRMQGLINDLLAYSRVQRCSRPFAPTELEPVFERVLLDLAVAIGENDAEITHDPLPTIEADEMQMGQLLQNLIGNALKFRREEKPRIHIGCRDEDDFHVFSVRDNGIGIPDDQHGRVFDVFQRLHPAEEYPGTGIGLAICRRIVERHGGRIWIESEPGKGSTFLFRLPRHPAGQ